MQVNQAARLFLAALAAGSTPYSSADPCPPVAVNCPPLQAGDDPQVMQCKGCFYSGECEAQGAGFSLEDDCQAVGMKLDPTKPCKGNLRRGSKCLQTAAWSQVAKLTADDGAEGDYFGVSVAVSGEAAIIGAYGDDALTGSAYIYEKADDGSWNNGVKLTVDDGAAGNGFGYSVAISGETAIIGAYLDDDEDSDSGSAYIFEKAVDGSWKQVTKITSNDRDGGEQFGYSVAISGDTAIIGAFRDNFNGFASGSAYIFEKPVGGSWKNPVATKLIAADGADEDLFGASVAISGETVIIGAYGDEDDGFLSGSAYIFEKVDGSWKQVSKLTADDGAEEDQFGRSVAISGETVIIGASTTDDNGEASGSAYIFEKVDGSWKQVVKLTADDGANVDLFGSSVNISGETVIIGAVRDDAPLCDSGSAYIFEKGVDGLWNLATKLTAADGAAYDYFGTLVAISGKTVIIGAFGDDAFLGSAYVFEIPE